MIDRAQTDTTHRRGDVDDRSPLYDRIGAASLSYGIVAWPATWGYGARDRV
jgi:hypothetical protein